LHTTSTYSAGLRSIVKIPHHQERPDDAAAASSNRICASDAQSRSDWRGKTLFISLWGTR